MVLDYLRLKDFRNYQHLEINLEGGVNVIEGMNGQGKTSILEAVHYLSFSKSFKTTDDNKALRFETDYFEIEGRFSQARGESMLSETVRVVFQKNVGKSVILHKKPLQKFSHLIGQFPLVFSAPEHVNIVSGPPSERRRWLDITLSQLSSTYLNDLQRYRQIVRQKNALLDGHAVDGAHLEAWNRELAQVGSKVIQKRIELIARFAPVIQAVYEELAGSNERIDLKYRNNSIEKSDEANLSGIEQELYNKISEARSREIQYRKAIIGPHKDELTFSLNGRTIRDYGSQGQWKTFAIALKLSEHKYLAERMDRLPIMLLDDVFAELDSLRQVQLMRSLHQVEQVFLTTTECPTALRADNNLNLFRIQDAAWGKA